jgi:hypothetical protein
VEAAAPFGGGKEWDSSMSAAAAVAASGVGGTRPISAAARDALHWRGVAVATAAAAAAQRRMALQSALSYAVGLAGSTQLTVGKMVSTVAPSHEKMDAAPLDASTKKMLRTMPKLVKARLPSLSEIAHRPTISVMGGGGAVAEYAAQQRAREVALHASLAVRAA